MHTYPHHKYSMVLVVLLVVAGAFAIGHANEARGDSLTVVDVDARFLFVPKGFDNNDQVEAVVDGYLPNSCYKSIAPVVTFDAEQKTFLVQPRAELLESPDVQCASYEVPFTERAKLGVVNTGQYTVKAAGADAKELKVTRSRSTTPDDNLYAPIDMVDVKVDISRRWISAVVKGHFNSTCMRWQELRLDDRGDTISLYPIARMQNRANCRAINSPFRALEIKLPWRGPGRYLLHTRSFNGAALNTAFTVDGE